MPTMPSSLIRLSDLSIWVKEYHATALATAVNMAIAPKARNNLALMPKVAFPAVLLATHGG